MKKSKFSDVKVVEIVRESRAEGVAATARKHKISEQTLYLWRRKYGGMEATQVVELKRLNQENARLKKLLAERIIRHYAGARERYIELMAHPDEVDGVLEAGADRLRPMAESTMTEVRYRMGLR